MKGRPGRAAAKPADASVTKTLLAALDRLPVAFALFDARRQLAAWNAPLAALGLFPKSILKQGVALAEFQRRDAGLKRRSSGPHDVKLPDGKLLEASRKRVPPGHLLLTYENVTGMRSAEADATEALERQKATAEILKVISGSPADLEPVFHAILANALSLCGAHLGILNLREGDLFRGATQLGGSPEFNKWIVGRGAFKPEYVLARMLKERQPVQVADMRETPAYKERKPITTKMVKLGRARTFLVVPLLKDGEVTGNIAIYRSEVRPFTQRQIELVRTFADQAVIAIENVRLLNETKEGLERQTAISEILRVISNSPGNVQPVLQAVAERAARICEAQFVDIVLAEGDTMRVRSSVGDTGRPIGEAIPLDRNTVMGRSIVDRKPVHVADLPSAGDEFPLGRQLALRFGHRTILAVPLLREDRALGTILVRRNEVRPIEDRHVSLLQTFADQAALAIENARLFNETKESLERQTATSEVLKAISRTAFDLNAVLQVLIENATRLAGANQGFIFRFDGDCARLAYSYNAPAAYRELNETVEFRPGRGGLVARTLLERRPVQIADALADPEFTLHDMQRAGGFRSMLGVPMMRDGNLIGVIAMWTTEVRPFTEKQMELVSTFADQAVIAIENVRLFNETKEALDRQTATAEILRVISRSPTDIQPVLDVVCTSAARLCEASDVLIRRLDGEVLRAVAHIGPIPLPDEVVAPLLSPDHMAGRAVIERRTIHIEDVTHPDVVKEYPAALSLAQKGKGFKSLLIVPLLRHDQAIGLIGVRRIEKRPFSDQQISLLQSFADQAVIAIENVRLFNETKEALDQQTAISTILRVMSDSPSDVTPVLEAVAESAMRICESTDARIFVVDGNELRYSAGQGDVPSIQIGLKRPLSRGSVMGRTVIDKVPVHVEDLAAVSEAEYPLGREIQRQLGHRTTLGVPLLREGRALGVILLRRKEVRAFTEKQISLLKTFADQAAIAMENVRLFNETKEALDRQTATAEILKVIASSPTDVQPVFDVIVERAVKLCGARFGRVYRYDGSLIQMVAGHGLSAAGLTQVQRVFPRPVADDTIVGRVILARQPYFLKDIRGDDTVPILSRQMIEALDTRSQVTIPMVRAGEPIGAITMGWDQPDGFDDRKVELLQTFADQAVIAIENVRLFNETKEALEQQTATSAILSVISSSPTDIQPVLDAVAAHAARVCGATDALIRRVDGDILRLAAHYGSLPKLDERVPLNRGSASGRAVVDRTTVHIHDLAAEHESDFPVGSALQKRHGHRTVLAVPLMREGAAIGSILIRRTEVRPFAEKQIALLKTFADQAVIAIENVRLFNETKEALERQTATAEILRVIASSPSDVQPVFDTVARKSVDLCGGSFGVVTRFDGELIHVAAISATASSIAEDRIRAAFPAPPSNRGAASRCILTREIVHMPDVTTDAEYTPDGIARTGGIRSILAVPLMRGGAPLGSVSVARTQAAAFTPHQIALLKTFADQAVIAIENVRLFNETKEALERQTATAETLKVIGASMTDTQPVFDAIVKNCRSLFHGSGVVLRLLENGMLTARAGVGTALGAVPLDSESAPGACVVEGRVVHLPDLVAAAERYPLLRNMGLRMGFRSGLYAPLLREGRAIGTLTVLRPEVGAFSDKDVALLTTFADQAVIAIENVRLFNETKEALERQTATAEILKVIASSPSDIQPVADSIAERAMALSGAAFGLVARFDGKLVHLMTLRGVNRDTTDAIRALYPLEPGSDSCTARAVRDRAPAQIPDVLADADYVHKSVAGMSHYRSILAVPLVREGKVIGAIAVGRAQPGAFPETLVEMLRTFADQAVIAIENVRLFNETKEALERQTATAEILKVISASPTDVRPVLDAVASSAARLCEAKDVAITLKEGDQLRYMAHQGEIPTAAQIGHTKQISNDWTAGRAALQGRQIHIRDVLDESEGLGEGARMGKQAGYRTVFATPLLRDGVVIGVIVMRRGEVRPFESRQVELVNIFAEQAVIAIENVRLFNETKESLERQTATAEILKVIASSPSDVQPVFDAIAASARLLLGGHAALVARRAGDTLELAAFTSTGEAGDSELSRLWPSKITGKGHMGKALLSAAPAWVEDIETDPGYSEEFRAGARARGMRSAVSVPMLREGEAIGVISVNRSIPGRFSDHQTNLLKTFADQALIAIENVRLFNETQEALARQEAATQVLRAISESVSDTAPVFTAILDCCNRLIPSIDYVQVLLIEGADRVRLVDHRFGQVRGAAPGKQEERKAELMAREAAHFPRPLAGSTLERALSQGRVVILADTLDGPDTPPAALVEARRWGHSYSQITVPLMREGRCIGAIEAFRRQLGGFEAKESSLLESFADQAVIAIENVRLFNETKEALERQTATAEILQVIGSSPTDTQPVFDAIVSSGVRLFPGAMITVARPDGGNVRAAAIAHEDTTMVAGWRERFTTPLSRDRLHAAAILDAKLIDFPDAEAEKDGPLGPGVRNFLLSGNRAVTIMPMLRGEGAIGAISVTRAVPGPLSDKQIGILRTFADQAVIAIENVRLFKELEARTEALTRSVSQLTALGEVGQAISSTLDLEKVLKTIASHAVQLTGLDGASIYEYDEAAAEFRLQVAHNFDPEFLRAIRSAPIRKGDGTVGGVAITLEPAQVTDILEGDYHSSRKELLARAGYRAVLTVPLLREDHIIGALSVTRKTPGPFAEDIVELLKTFATQSAMAIQNARLFREIAEKGKQLEEASRHKSQFLASMSHELRTPLNAILGFNEMILGDIYGEVPADMKEPLTDIQTSGKHLLRLINNVLDLAKIEAGRMELALDDYSVHDTVESVRSTLRPLAEAKGLELAVIVPPEIPLARGDGGRITQCLMNLAGNSLKFTKQGSVGISVALENGTLTYRVKDTGIGIPADKIGSLFTEFKQTDATIASEYGGTGLGLSITKKFIEMHGGRIWVESEPGSGSTFIFEIPLRAGEAGEA